MSVHPFLELLGFDKAADIDAVERRFLDVVKDHLQNVSTNYDEAEVRGQEAWLRDLHNRFFQYALEWVMEESRQHKAPPTAEALKLKKQAREIMGDLQRHMVEFACCYMHLNRYVTLLRDEMRGEEERLGVGGKDTKWTSDTGTMVARYNVQKRQLADSAERMKKAGPLAAVVDGHLGDMRLVLTKIHGADKADLLQRSLVAALRTKEFTRARKALSDILESAKNAADASALDSAGRAVIAACEEHQDLFVSDEGRLFLKPSETDQAYNVSMRELAKIKAIMGKYYRPYMQYKIETLFHLKDKLLVIGSIEGQTILYRRLLTGFAAPLAEMKDLRAYESDVLDKIKYLLGSQFQEVPVILARARETVGEFRSGAEEFRDIEKLDTGGVGDDTIDQAAASA